MQTLTKTDIDAIKTVIDLAVESDELDGIEDFTEQQKRQLWDSLTHEQRAKMHRLFMGLPPKQLAAAIAFMKVIKFGWELETMNVLPPKHKRIIWDALDEHTKLKLKTIKEEWDGMSIDERDSIKAMRDLGYLKHD